MRKVDIEDVRRGLDQMGPKCVIDHRCSACCNHVWWVIRVGEIRLDENCGCDKDHIPLETWTIQDIVELINGETDEKDFLRVAKKFGVTP